MTDKLIRELDGVASITNNTLFEVEKDRSSGRVSAISIANYVDSKGLQNHLDDTTPHGITTFAMGLLANANLTDLLADLGILTFAGTPGSDYTITICGTLKIGLKDASVSTGTTTVAYATDTNYSSWARAFMAGDDSTNDVSTSLVSWTTSGANIYSHASGSVAVCILSIGV